MSELNEWRGDISQTSRSPWCSGMPSMGLTPPVMQLRQIARHEAHGLIFKIKKLENEQKPDNVDPNEVHICE